MSLVACSGESGPDGDNMGTPDSGTPIDPNAPDAAPPIPACNGGAVPDPIYMNGEVANLIDNEVIGGALVTVRARQGDTKIDEMTTDLTGAYAFTLATGAVPWQGYFRVQHAEHLDTLLYPTQLDRDIADVPLPLLNESNRSLGALLAGVQLDEDLGVVVAFFVDCDNQGVAGVSYKMDNGIDFLYLGGDSVDPDATATDASGIALAFNVPLGSVSVTATQGGVDITNDIQSVTNTVTGALFVP